jgi:hypothetical protein
VSDGPVICNDSRRRRAFPWQFARSVFAGRADVARAGRTVGIIAMPSKPIPGSTGEVLTSLPSPYLPHFPTGLLYLPRFLAKCRYVKIHGSLPASYAKNYKRGLDRFLCLHLGIDPSAVERIVHEVVESRATEEELTRRLLVIFPADVRAAKWNRELVQKGMTPAGREFLGEALKAMGCSDRVEQIISVPDLIEFDEGRIE